MNLPRITAISAHFCTVYSKPMPLKKKRRAPAFASNIGTVAATRTRRPGSELTHARAQHSNHELGGAVHRPLRHATLAHIIGRLQRHFESEIFAPPDLEFADRLSLCDRCGDRARIDDPRQQTLAVIPRQHHPYDAGRDERHIAFVASKYFGIAYRLPFGKQNPGLKVMEAEFQ